MSVQAILFDFDGVIADTEGRHLLAFQRVLEPRGLTLDAAVYTQHYLGYTDREMIHALRHDRGLAWDAAEIDAILSAKCEVFARMLAEGGVLYPSARACIERLAATRPLAIASGAHREEIAHILAGASLASHFLAIVGAGEVARGKPDPEPFLEAARRIGVSPESCVAIEDSPWGLQSASRAGCLTVAVTHTYRRAQLTADAIVDSLDEIASEWLDRL
jgi:beta-phosphoglucomutase